MGLSQIGHLDKIMVDRRRTAQLYDEKLSSSDAIQLHLPPADANWSYQSYVVVLADGINRDTVITKMRDCSIETTIGTYACHAQPAYLKYGYRPGDLKNSYRFQQQALTLPLLPNMDEELINRVCSQLLRIVGG
jgi:dTDP-4-amino-4,6-dideoxygalactose transaminase